MNKFVEVPIFQTKEIAEKAKNDELFKTQIVVSLGRFYGKDWGDTDLEGMLENEEAYKRESSILAVYGTCQGDIWLIAESDNGERYDRIVVLFPCEY